MPLMHTADASVPHLKQLRVIAGINPYASEYELPKGDIFRTPEFIYTYSNACMG